jgi:hypothetical protein
VELPGFRADAGDANRSLMAFEEEVSRRGARALVVVDDRVRLGPYEWVYNRADLDAAPVLWIQDLGATVTSRVATEYRRGETWRLVPRHAEGGVRLVREPGAGAPPLSPPEPPARPPA